MSGAVPPLFLYAFVASKVKTDCKVTCLLCRSVHRNFTKQFVTNILSDSVVFVTNILSDSVVFVTNILSDSVVFVTNILCDSVVFVTNILSDSVVFASHYQTQGSGICVTDRSASEKTL